MKLAIVVGLLFLLAGLGLADWGVSTDCSDNHYDQVDFQIPSCTFADAVATVGGIAFVAGVILLAVGVRALPPMQPPGWKP